MTQATRHCKGLLLAAMEPPADWEEEFQAWYDTEHIPERLNIPGFETATRFVCLDGWPRYLAAYDLAEIEVLHRPAYLAVAGDSASPWTRRIVSKVSGQYRAEFVQIYPGQAHHGQLGPCARLVMYRFRQMPTALETQAIDGLRRIYEELPELVQLRVFKVPSAESPDYVALVELRRPVPLPDLLALGNAARHIDVFNTYTTYARQISSTAPDLR